MFYSLRQGKVHGERRVICCTVKRKHPMTMKKSVALFSIFFAVLAFSISSFAQEKTGEENGFGSKKGGFAVSFGLQPVVNFVGNMFNNSSNLKLSSVGGVANSFYSGATLSGKYFLTDRLSLDAGLGINCLGTKKYSYSGDSSMNKKTSTGSNDLMFTLGMQFYFRKGKRVQPFLGIDALYAHANDGYEKADDIVNSTATLQKSPSNTFGVIADLGVEIFVCRCVSFRLGADLGWAHTVAKQTKKSESEDYSRVASSSTRFATGMTGADIALNFYF